tara:strand:- start:1389 stop:1616 length:228 start_codon:yes stop_codon:yes gene_type:complete
MSDFNSQTVEEEVVMLSGMIEELDNGIETAHESKRKLISIRAALASAIDMELPADDKSQLNLTFVAGGGEPNEAE